jgi:hypothetical protein
MILSELLERLMILHELLEHLVIICVGTVITLVPKPVNLLSPSRVEN